MDGKFKWRTLWEFLCADVPKGKYWKTFKNPSGPPSTTEEFVFEPVTAVGNSACSVVGLYYDSQFWSAPGSGSLMSPPDGMSIGVFPHSSGTLSSDQQFCAAWFANGGLSRPTARSVPSGQVSPFDCSPDSSWGCR